jgi:hypothetical protein
MRRIAVLLLIGMVVLGALVWLRPPARKPAPPQPEPAAPAETAEAVTPSKPARPVPFRRTERPGEGAVAQAPQAESPPAPVNKAERLAQLRENFRTLAASDARTALGAARQLTNDVERETALLTLVTEWKHGELGSPKQRAAWITSFGLEAGIGLELGLSHPDLAVLWANELTDGRSRFALLQKAAVGMLGTDPAGALALGDQVGADNRKQFVDSVFLDWASTDTDAALRWAGQLPEGQERDGALSAIRHVAPVGIGAELMQQDGYAVVGRLLPGAPAELGGQLHAGDRIVALAQGNQAFVDARGMALKDIVGVIRGEPGTVLQLQVLPAGAPPDSAPRTISIIRDQVKFKR